jgi:hypothetical protein
VDERLRELARAAIADPEVKAQLGRARTRVGLCPGCGERRQEPICSACVNRIAFEMARAMNRRVEEMSAALIFALQPLRQFSLVAADAAASFHRAAQRFGVTGGGSSEETGTAP